MKGIPAMIAAEQCHIAKRPAICAKCRLAEHVSGNSRPVDPSSGLSTNVKRLADVDVCITMQAAVKRRRELEGVVADWEATAQRESWDLSVQPAPVAIQIAELSAGAQYVEALLELDALELLEREAHLLAVAAPGRPATHASSDRHKQRQQLQKKAARLQTQLGASEPWQRTDAPYQQASQELRQAKVAQMHLLIQSEVSELAALRKMQEASGMAGQDTRRLRDRAMKHQRNIREQLHLLEIWQRYAHDGAAALPTYDVQKIFQGDLPWLPHCLSAAATCTYAQQRHFFAKQELQRCREHPVLVSAKVSNARAFYRHRVAAIEAAMRAAIAEADVLKHAISSSDHQACMLYRESACQFQHHLGRYHILASLLRTSQRAQQLASQVFEKAGI